MQGWRQSARASKAGTRYPPQVDTPGEGAMIRPGCSSGGWCPMQIDWHKTIEEILADRMACPRCGTLTEEVVAGYTREPWGAEYAPRCQFCTRKEDCDARKLVVLCAACANELGLRARKIDQETLMGMLINDCRKDLEECLDYLAEYWQ